MNITTRHRKYVLCSIQKIHSVYIICMVFSDVFFFVFLGGGFPINANLRPRMGLPRPKHEPGGRGKTRAILGRPLACHP